MLAAVLAPVTPVTAAPLPLRVGLVRSVVRVLGQLLLLPIPLARLLTFRIATIPLIGHRRMRNDGSLAAQASLLHIFSPGRYGES